VPSARPQHPRLRQRVKLLAANIDGATVTTTERALARITLSVADLTSDTTAARPIAAAVRDHGHIIDAIAAEGLAPLPAVKV
jgi:hypothetical protein